jgi:haloalkane dehalogenase
MYILRTPDERFHLLADFAFTPHYATLRADDGSALRMHYLDEGPAAAAPVLLLHGEPSWCYLYRHIVPALASRGHRVLAPDLIGFGRSDKPAARSDYSCERHVDWLSQWLTGLELSQITLFCQDWGGLLGLRLVAAFPDRFARVIVSNTGLPVGKGAGPGFENWLNYSQTVPVFEAGKVVAMGVRRALTAAEIAAYDAPFPDQTYTSGARQFPALVPITPDHPSVPQNMAAWEVLGRFEKPFVTAFSDADPVTRGGEAVFHKRVPGTRGQAHCTLRGAHFIQEDAPHDIVRLIESMAPSPAA